MLFSKDHVKILQYMFVSFIKKMPFYHFWCILKEITNNSNNILINDKKKIFREHNFLEYKIVINMILSINVKKPKCIINLNAKSQYVALQTGT